MQIVATVFVLNMSNQLSGHLKFSRLYLRITNRRSVRRMYFSVTDLLT